MSRTQAVLAGLLAFSLLIRLGGLNEPMVYPDDWGHAAFLLFARNYADHGWLRADTVPYYGVVAGEPILYPNHPWLVPLLLSAWGMPFGYSEFSYRTLAIVFSLASVAAIFLLARRLAGEEAGVVAALLFSVAPLSIHTGRTYCLELVHVCFLLWFCFFLERWRADRGSLVPCAIALALAQLSDLFGLFASAWLLILAAWEWRRKGDWKVYAGLASVPVVVQLLLTGILVNLERGSETWNQSVARVAPMWDLWRSGGYWIESAVKVGWNYAYLLPVLALVGLIIPTKGRTLRGSSVSFWWFFPLLYVLLGAHWFSRHNHLALFFGPALSLQAALLLLRAPRWARVVAVAVHVGISLFLYLTVFHQRLPYHYQEMQFARAVKAGVKPGDLLVGLPPHIAYYVHYRDVVPWNIFLSAAVTGEEQALKRLAPMLEGYERVVVFPQFMEWQQGVTPLDFSRLFPPGGGWRLERAQPNVIVIWERTSDEPSGASLTDV